MERTGRALGSLYAGSGRARGVSAAAAGDGVLLVAERSAPSRSLPGGRQVIPNDLDRSQPAAAVGRV